MSLIFHIATRTEWNAAAESGDYRISTLGATLAEVGFIHCSTAEQVQHVADRFYRGVSDLLLLTLETDRIGSPVRFDPVGSETYPHVYGPVDLTAVVRVTVLMSEPDGRVIIPDLTIG